MRADDRNACDDIADYKVCNAGHACVLASYSGSLQPTDNDTLPSATTAAGR